MLHHGCVTLVIVYGSGGIGHLQCVAEDWQGVTLRKVRRPKLTRQVLSDRQTGWRIRLSAGMPNPVCKRQTMARVKGRLRLSTS